MDVDGHVHTAPLDGGQLEPLLHVNIGVKDAVLPVFFQFPDRLLDQPPLFEGEFAGQCHHAEPFTGSGVVVAALPGLHPGDHDPASVRSQQGLRRVEIEAEINGVHGFSRKAVGLLIKAAGQVDIAEAVVEGAPAGEHFLRGGDQDCRAVHCKEIRALPHPAVLVPAAVKDGEPLPGEGVRAAEEEDRSAPVRGAVGYDGKVHLFFIIPPDLGIAEIQDAPVLGHICIRQHGVMSVFHIIPAVSEGHTLHLAVFDKAVRPLPLLNACVHQKLTAVFHLNRAAGKTSSVVEALIRGQRRRQPLPLDKIRGLHMPPVHGAPGRAVGIILVKQMILPLIHGETVGIVHPSDPGHNMKKRPFPIRNPVSINLLVFPSLLQF